MEKDEQREEKRRRGKITKKEQIRKRTRLLHLHELSFSKEQNASASRTDSPGVLWALRRELEKGAKIFLFLFIAFSPFCREGYVYDKKCLQSDSNSDSDRKNILT